MKNIVTTPRTVRRLCLALPPMLILAAQCNSVFAREGNVFSVTASELVQYDDNIFRQASDAGPKHDVISTTTIALDANKTVGRHTFYGELAPSYIAYQDLSRLNYTREKARVGWSGVFGASNAWDSYYTRSAVQSDFSDAQTTQTNKLTTDTLGANLTVRFAKDWVLRPAVYEDRFSNSNTARRSGDGKADNFLLNFGYRPYTRNVVEAQYRHTQRDYDIGGGVSQNEIGLLTTYVVSAATELDFRAALLHQDTTNASINGNGNFDHAIGYANYRWKSSGASTLNFKIYREVSTVNVGVDQDAISQGALAQWTWKPLAKVTFNTSYDFRRRVYPQLIGQSEKIQSIDFGASYAPITSLTVRASARDERRNAEVASRSYNARVYGVSLAYQF